MNMKKFSLKCRQILYCVTTILAGKLLVTQFCNVCDCVYLRSNFLSERCFSLKFLLDVVLVFLKQSNIIQQNLVIKKLNADFQLQADFTISHLYKINADYFTHFRLLCGSALLLISKFYVSKITSRSL